MLFRSVQGPRVTGTPFRQGEPSLAQPTAEHRQAVHAKPSDELLVRLPETAVRPLSTLALGPTGPRGRLPAAGAGTKGELALAPSKSRGLVLQGADFFKNRILKGLKESLVLKGLTLSREQEKSKVGSPAVYFRKESLLNKVDSRGSRRSAHQIGRASCRDRVFRPV